MVVLAKKLNLIPSDIYTHIKIPFNINGNFDKVKIKFKYTPKALEDYKKAKPIILEGFAIYHQNTFWSDKEMITFMPLNNLITLSLDSPIKHLGAAHRHPNNQTHIISSLKSSRGFLQSKIFKGQWMITISCNYIATENIEVCLELSCE